MITMTLMTKLAITAYKDTGEFYKEGNTLDTLRIVFETE